MSKMRIVYLYIVCIITLGLAIGGIIFTVNNTVERFHPTSFRNDFSSRRSVSGQNERRRVLRNTLNSAAVTIVAAPVYLYHWKKVNDEKKELEVN